MVLTEGCGGPACFLTCVSADGPRRSPSVYQGEYSHGLRGFGDVGAREIEVRSLQKLPEKAHSFLSWLMTEPERERRELLVACHCPQGCLWPLWLLVGLSGGLGHHSFRLALDPSK